MPGRNREKADIIQNYGQTETRNNSFEMLCPLKSKLIFQFIKVISK